MKDPLFVSLLTAALVSVAPPAVARDQVCQFRAGGLSMTFAPLDPSSGINATASLSVPTGADQAGDCQQVTMTIDGDGGLNGGRRLKNAAGDFIPYALVGLPVSTAAPGNNKYRTFAFTGLILWTAYANASAGTYTDTLRISVTP